MRHTRLLRPSHLALSLIVTALTLLALAPSALAFQTRTPLGAFGPGGTSATSFANADPLAFHQGSDTLYVVERTSAGSAIHAFNAPFDALTHSIAPAAGAFPLSIVNGRSIGIAVDNTLGASANNIYDIESISPPNAPGEIKIFGFDDAGAPLAGYPIKLDGGRGPRGIAVDSAGTVWVSDVSELKAIFKYDAAGDELGELAIPQGRPKAVAFDSNDNLYVSVLVGASQSPGGVWKYTAPTYNTATATRIIPPGTNISALTVDRNTDTLYVADTENNSIAAHDSSGTRLYGFGVDLAGGVAVDESADEVYSSSLPVSGSDENKVRVFGELDDFPDAIGTPQPASDIAATKAELNATIDDNSILPTKWRFQVSKDNGASWTENCGGQFTPGGQSGFAVSCTAFSLQSDTAYLFRVITSKGFGSTEVISSSLSFTTLEIPPAIAEPIPCSVPKIVVTEADLCATIDDNGPLPTAWRFEVSKDNGATWAKPAGTNVSGTTAGGQSGVVGPGTAKGLDPGTEYLLRIVTKKDPGAPDVPSAVTLPFTTLTSPPTVSDVGAVGVTDTSAYLAGEINPRNQVTSYIFKYGLTPALEFSTPPTDIGGGVSPVAVSQQIVGLTPDTTYEFKLVATNTAEEKTESAVLTLHTSASPPGPHPDRAYEQVTPPDKNFGNPGGEGGAVAWDGQAISFGMVTGFGDPPGQIGFIRTEYRSARGADGWRTRWLGEPLCATDIDQSIGNVNTAVRGLSPNLDRGVIARQEGGSCPLPPLDPDAPLPAQENLYLGDYRADPIPYDLLTTQAPNGSYQAGSEDFSHVVYASNGNQTPDAPAGNFQKLYDWHEGSLSLVSKDTANVPLSTDSFVPQPALGGVSPDGSRIFFQSTPAGASQELYMRQNGTTTYDVSQSECTSSCGADSADAFRWATPTANKALLTSAAKLTNDDTSTSGENLFLYTHTVNPAAKNLTLLSKDSEPADGTAADVQGVLGMSDGGGTVFFVANGQIVAGAPTSPGPKIYRWSSSGPTLDYLATIDKADSLNWATSFEGQTRPGSRVVTPEGTQLLVNTIVRLDPAADHDSDSDVYRWEQEGGWSCLSCQLPGTASGGGSTFQLQGQAVGSGCCALRSVMSDDGQRVFFVSEDGLVSEDINGVADVYEWYDGTVALISSGHEAGDARLLGSSRSGDDVFFTTHERLVGWDTDDNSDIYDARIGGGFPEPPVPPICEGEACRGSGTSAPSSSPAGSAGFQGPGNPKPRPRCRKGKVRRHGRCVAKKHHGKRGNHKRAANHKRGAGR